MPKLRGIFAIVLTLQTVAAQDMPPVGRIVVFGDMHLESAVRAILPTAPLTLNEEAGDRIQKQLKQSSQWQESELSWVCCEPAGTAILYVGVRQTPSARQSRQSPTGTIRLEADDLITYQQLMDLNHQAVTSGDSGPEDNRAGHALSSYLPIQRLQQQIVQRAATRQPEWREVALTSSDRAHRAAAVHLLPYGPKDEALAEALATAALDPDPLVRNNAVRAIAVLAHSAVGRSLLRSRWSPLLELFQSVHWTDWNKASFALMALTESADPSLLADIANRAAEPLRQIASWPAMHSTAAELILQRISNSTPPKK